MAINKDDAKKLVEGVNRLVDEMGRDHPKLVSILKDILMGKVLKELEELVFEARPPVLFLVGRSGHGKSSLINALANRDVAEVGHVEPTTYKAEKYRISFKDRFSEWDIVDTRGLFETTKPEGATIESATEQLVEDFEAHRPDVVIHVVSAPEVRNLERDFEVLQMLKETARVFPPVLIVLTKADTLGNPREC